MDLNNSRKYDCYYWHELQMGHLADLLTSLIPGAHDDDLDWPVCEKRVCDKKNNPANCYRFNECQYIKTFDGFIIEEFNPEIKFFRHGFHILPNKIYAQDKQRLILPNSVRKIVAITTDLYVRNGSYALDRLFYLLRNNTTVEAATVNALLYHNSLERDK